MGNLELDKCVNCGAGLISVSDICPQCGWAKNNSIGDNEENVDSDIEKVQHKNEHARIKKKIFRPTGVRLISISYMTFGISLVLFGIVFVSAVMFLVMSNTMGELGGIGGDMGNIPMLPGMSGIDASTKSSLDSIIDLNRIMGSPSANEIEIRMNSSGIMNIDLMMEIIKEASIIALIEIIVGLLIFVVGIGLAKGKKLARLVTIISSIISIPLIISFVTAEILVIFGMAVFNGMIIHYMLKSKAREYFNQNSIKKSKNNTSQNKISRNKNKQSKK